jgi:tripartite-type tricarboxylate transporter receptor subunit TctC
LIAAIPQVKSGKLKAIAVTGEKRHPDYPEIPTVKESGYPDYVNYTWTSIYIRTETPDAVTAKLVDAVKKIMTSPAGKAFIAKIGSDPLALAGDDMRKFQLDETERFRRVALGAGIKPE